MIAQRLVLEEAYGHRYAISQLAGLEAARDAILSLPAIHFDRYDNPFEGKYTLRDKFTNHPAITDLLEELESWSDEVGELFGAELLRDTERHYAGVFKYTAGDHLGVHVDAGIHPINGRRKHVTALVYLSETTGQGGDLEFWTGASSALAQPILYNLVDTVRPHFGQVVLFENNDYAWHGMSPYRSDEPRLVVTVSYLSDDLERFGNHRQRAYFVQRPGEAWDDRTIVLRDQRADAHQFKEVYRT